MMLNEDQGRPPLCWETKIMIWTAIWRTSSKNFELKWSDPIFHRVSVMEVAISSMVSKTFIEKRFSRNLAFAKCRGMG